MKSEVFISMTMLKTFLGLYCSFLSFFDLQWQGEKVLAWSTTDIKLETSGRWVWTRTGAGVTAKRL